jgi:uncharacterized protein (TIGR02300 family)
MSRPELGSKRTCTGCRERFYDLNRSSAICPECDTPQAPESLRVLRLSRSPTENRPPHRPSDSFVADDDVAPASTSEAEDDEDTSEPEDEINDDIGTDADNDKAPD